MTFDPDNVRVDLLRIKRKLYISYPEGSKERSDFLIASKVSELGYLTKLVDPETVRIVFEEYKYRLRSEIYSFLSCIIIGFCLSMTLLGFHQSHPTNLWLALYKLPFLFGVGYSGTHIAHFIRDWKDFQPFRHEYENLKKKIAKLMDEIKGLTK